MSAPPPITFRVSEEQYRVLLELAEGKQTTPNLLAKDRVLMSLEKADASSVNEDRLEIVQEKVEALCHDLPLIAEALLKTTTHNGEISPEGIERWIRENLRTKD